ncbi:MAG: ribonuclease Z [Gemmatimonadota bacterium]|nr:MAG: ribonuclease Z [Gemmatimonadota bacterium]
MELVVVGSGTVAPTADRTAPAHWVTTGTTRLLLDCGAGTLHRAATLAIPWQQVTHIAVTHFHMDHWGELPAYLFALRWGIEPARAESLEIIGPLDLRRRLTALAQALGDWVLEPGYPLQITELEPGSSHKLQEGVTLETCKTPHTDRSVAYAVRDQVAHLVYTGDTGPSDELADWAAGCDLLLAECSLPDDRALDVHLTPLSAGELGRAARAGHLVLTHCYPVFGDTDPASIASRAFGAPVEMAYDGARYVVERRKQPRQTRRCL